MNREHIEKISNAIAMLGEILFSETGRELVISWGITEGGNEDSFTTGYWKSKGLSFHSACKISSCACADLMNAYEE